MTNPNSVLEKTLNRRVPLADATGDWDRVLVDAGSARRDESGSSRFRWSRRGLVAALTLALAILGASTALGLSSRGYELFGSKDPAPARVVQSFNSLERAAPAGMAPAVIPDATRAVLTKELSNGDSSTLWVAPTATGAFCWQLGIVGDSGVSRGSSGGCNDRRRILSAALTIPGPVRAATIQQSTVAISGAVVGEEVDGLQLRFADGEEVRVPLAWISPPIDAGFFVYGLRSENLRPASAPTQLVAVDRDGHAVGEYRLDFAQIMGRLGR